MHVTAHFSIFFRFRFATILGPGAADATLSVEWPLFGILARKLE